MTARVISQDVQNILMFKGLIASLTEEQQLRVMQAEKQLRAVIAEYPDGEAMIAFGLIAAQEQAKHS